MFISLAVASCPIIEEHKVLIDEFCLWYLGLDCKSSYTQMHSQLFRTAAILFTPLVFFLLGVSQCPFLLSYLLLREAAQLCHVFTSFLLGLFLFTGDEALFATHLLFLEVSKEERLWRKGGMHRLKG